MLYAKYIAKEKTPVFEGAYKKLRQQWPEFVAFKAFERAKEMSEKNKANAEKKEHHHILGPDTTRKIATRSAPDIVTRSAYARATATTPLVIDYP
jgi:hypothetical protein